MLDRPPLVAMWRVELEGVPSGDQGQVLTIRGNNTLQFNDVVVGDVWVGAGQSNMEFGLQIADAVQIRVHDSTADMRYIVLPMRPKGTEGWDEP